MCCPRSDRRFSRAGSPYDPLDVHIGATESNRPFKNATVLLASDGVVNGIFNVGAVENGNRKPSIAPLLGSATASGQLKVVLRNGNTLSITNLESAQPYGHALFEALIVPDAAERFAEIREWQYA